jgi:drug/metabolite transporter (DMT)-like permease
MDQQSLSGRIRSGDLIVLCATTIWAANTVYIKRIISGFEPFHIALYSTGFSVPFLLMGSLVFDEAILTSPTTASVLALLYQSLITGSFGLLIWNTLLKRHGIVAMHSFVFIMPIAAVALAAVVLGDPIGPSIIAALILIVAGIFVVHSPPAADLPPSPARPDP